MAGTATEYTLHELLGAVTNLAEINATGFGSMLTTLTTEAKLELVRALLASIDGKDFATQTTLAALLTELQAKADLDETQPVSVASLPLPSGAATETTLAAIQAAVEKIDDLQQALSSIAGDEIRVEITTDPVPVVPEADEKIIGFKDTVAGTVSDTALAEGDNALSHTAVPAGEIHVITNIAQYYIGTAPTSQGIRAIIDSTGCVLDWRAGAVFPDTFVWQGMVVLGPGDRIQHIVYGATLNDDLYGSIVGYKFDAP